MLNGVIAVVLNIVLNIILSRYLGIGGLALATSISGMVATLLLFVALKKKIGSFGLKEITLSLGKITASSVIMGFIASCVYSNLGNLLSLRLSLVIAIGVGILSYFVLIHLMRVPEAERTLESLRKRFLQRQLVNKVE